jgi:hypothetical protein
LADHSRHRDASITGFVRAISPRDEITGRASMDDVFLEIHHFEPLVDKTVHFGNTGFSCPLIKIIKGQKFLAAAKRDPFMLVFRAPRGKEYLAEGTYHCAFEDGPAYEIYVSPIHTAEPEWQDYQAIFN